VIIGGQMKPQIAEAFDLTHWANWFGSLEPSFVFLLCLPFVVAAAGLLADFARRRANLKSAVAATSVDQSSQKN
jgi:hypothetical protein